MLFIFSVEEDLGRLLLSVGKNSAIVNSSFRREVNENCVLMGHYAAGVGNSVPKIRSHLQRSRNKKKRNKFSLRLYC